MRASIAMIAGAAAVASAKTTLTETVDVTVTSCEPTVTNCPYKAAATTEADPTWGDWTTTTSSIPVSVVATTSSKPYDPENTWGDWTSTTSSIPVSVVTTSSKPYDPENTWGDWTSTTSSTPVSVVTTSTSSSSAACGSYTATTPPAWFSLLPSEALSSLSAEWTGAPPSDWCYYTYSTASLSTIPVIPVTATSTATPYWPAGTTSTPVADASTGSVSGSGVWSYSP